MRQTLGTLEVGTPGRGFTDITSALVRWVATEKARRGLLHVFIQHTSASLVVQENADPDVRSDLETFFSRLVPDGWEPFAHSAEGPDDMPAHVRAALTLTSLTLSVDAGALRLGTWQAVYLAEHRHGAHRRRLALHFIGD